jgi:hypothetical protein
MLFVHAGHPASMSCGYQVVMEAGKIRRIFNVGPRHGGNSSIFRKIFRNRGTPLQRGLRYLAPLFGDRLSLAGASQWEQSGVQ